MGPSFQQGYVVALLGQVVGGPQSGPAGTNDDNFGGSSLGLGHGPVLCHANARCLILA